MDMNALLRAHQIALASGIRRTRKAGGADVDAARFVVGASAGG
jgi:hypothetical protein